MPSSDEYTEFVLDVVASIPHGRVASYGAVSVAVRLMSGRGSARTVGTVMANHGSQVCWWRVVNAAGGLAPRVAAEQRRRLVGEGVPFRGERVDMAAASIQPVPPGLLGGTEGI